MALSQYVIGRTDLPFVTESEVITVGAELGIVFLLFFLGLEFNLDRLLEKRAQITTAGTIDLLVNFGVGFLLGLVIFRSLLPAFLTAGIVYISSSAVITKSLIDMGWIANSEAEPMLGTLVFEDLVIAVYLAVTTAIVLGAGGLEAAAVDIAIAIGFILGLLVLVYAGTDLFKALVDTDSKEFLVLRTLAVTVFIAGLALALGVSEAVAAFFVGMAFSSLGHDEVERIERTLEPLRDAFAAIFFFWIGLVTDPFLFPGVALLVVAAVAVTAPAKLVSGFVGGRAYGLSDRRSLRVGLALVTRGEFSLIVATLALSGAGTTLSVETAETIYAGAVGYVLVMSLLGTVLMQYSGVVDRFLPGETPG
jgi:CPA2 family monovalent cation:H+ antiporter-2